MNENLSSPPQRCPSNPQSFCHWSDGPVKPSRVARISGRRTQIGKMLPPKLVELHHQQLTQIFAGHGRQSDTEMLGVSSRLEGEADRSTVAASAVTASIGRFFVRNYHPLAQGLLKHSEIKVSAPVFIDHKIDRFVASISPLSRGC